MIRKGDITSNCIIKLHELVFVSTYMVASFIIYIPHVLFILYSLNMH